MQLRIRHPNGETRMVDVDPDVEDLAGLESKTRAAFAFAPVISFQLLLASQPPKALLGNANKLCSLGISQPQVLLISNLTPSSAPVASNKSKAKVVKKTKTAPAAARRGNAEEDADEDYDSQDSEEEARPKQRKRASRAKTSSFVASNTIKKPKPAAAAAARPKTVEGLGEALASAHETGGAASEEAATFRKMTKAQLNLQYEIAAAEARYGAALRNEFEIFQSSAASTYRLGDGAPLETKLLVKYRKGPRSFATDEVQGMSPEVLRHAIASLLEQQPAPAAAAQQGNYNDADSAFHHPREKLRPHILPMTSPRVFWSLVHWHGGGENCIARALVALLPDYDWSFLDVRVRLASQLGKDSKRTQEAFDRLEEAEHREQEVDDGLVEVCPSWHQRTALRQRGIHSLEALAQSTSEDAGLVLAAQDLVHNQLLLQLVPNPAHWDKLRELNFCTVVNIKRLSIPGRSAFVQRELGVTSDEVEQWITLAGKMVEQNAWLANARYK